MTLAQIAQVIELVFAIGGGAGVVWALARMKGIELTVTILTAGNDELRAQNEDLRKQVIVGTEALHAERLDCSKRIANLEGQMQVITSSLAKDIVAAVTEAARNAADAAALIARSEAAAKL